MSPSDRAKVSAFLHHDHDDKPTAVATTSGGGDGSGAFGGNGASGGGGGGGSSGGGGGARSRSGGGGEGAADHGGGGGGGGGGSGMRYRAQPLPMGGKKSTNKKNLPVYAFGPNNSGGHGGSEQGTLRQGRLGCLKMGADAAEGKEKPVFGKGRVERGGKRGVEGEG